MRDAQIEDIANAVGINRAIVYTVLIAFVINHTEKLQRQVESHYTDMAERTTDTLGNIALIQSYARIESEVSQMSSVGDKL